MSSLIALSHCQDEAITSEWLSNRVAEGPQESKQVVQLVMTGSVCKNSMCAGDSQEDLILAGAGPTHCHMGPGSAVQPELWKVEDKLQDMEIAADSSAY